MIITDLHVHPSPWRDGPGSFHSFVRAAIRHDIVVLGFAEHGPTVSSDPRYRGLNEQEIEAYVEDVRNLKDEFKGVIQIFCGLELDYHPDYLDRFSALRRTFPLDYILGSIHVIDDWHLDSRESLLKSVHRDKTEEELYRLYFNRLSEAVRCDIFDGLAHPDYYRRSLPHPPGQPPEFSLDIFEDFAVQAVKRGMTIEVNTRGLTLDTIQEIYPNRSLLKRLLRTGAHFFLGSDAHEEESVGQHLRQTGRMLSREGVETVVYFQQHQMLEVSL